MDLLHPISTAVRRQPVLVVGMIILVTAMMMTLSILKPIDSEFSESSFLPDHEVVQAADDISDKFVSSRSVPLLIHAKTPTGEPNIITSDAMVELLELERAIANDTTIGGNLSVTAEPGASFVSLPHLLAQVLDPDNATDLGRLVALYQGMTDEEIQQALADATEIPGLGGYVRSLASRDLPAGLTTGSVRAEATLMLVELNSTTRSQETDEEAESRIEKVELRVNDIVQAQTETNLRSVALSYTVLDNEINEATQETTSMLLMLAFIMVILILVAIYRSASDLLFSLLALIFAIIWVGGFQIILGFQSSPFSMVVPILLVGLGVDYGIHLTMRYRETLVEDNDIDRAARPVHGLNSLPSRVYGARTELASAER